MSTARRPADIARRSAQALAGRTVARDSFRRETFALPREAARDKAREMFRRFPKAAYMTEIEVLARSCRATASSSPCGGCRARIDAGNRDYC